MQKQHVNNASDHGEDATGTKCTSEEQSPEPNAKRPRTKISPAEQSPGVQDTPRTKTSSAEQSPSVQDAPRTKYTSERELSKTAEGPQEVKGRGKIFEVIYLVKLFLLHCHFELRPA